jgi:hypothetical protein
MEITAASWGDRQILERADRFVLLAGEDDGIK